jgi:hypothetical protein
MILFLEMKRTGESDGTGSEERDKWRIKLTFLSDKV